MGSRGLEAPEQGLRLALPAGLPGWLAVAAWGLGKVRPWSGRAWVVLTRALPSSATSGTELSLQELSDTAVPLVIVMSAEFAARCRRELLCVCPPERSAGREKACGPSEV